MNDNRMQQLAGLLVEARRSGVTLSTVPDELVPADKDEAYSAQLATIAALGGEGGYKIGAGTPEAVPQCAPLPADKVLRDGATLPFAGFSHVGLELEIAFRFGDSIDASLAGLDDAAILARIATVHVTSEVVDSRYADYPKTPKLAQLADLQNNGALVVGDGVPYRDDLPWLAPTVAFRCGTHDIFKGVARNPCGDPRRLVVWLVRDLLARGRTLGAGHILTCGSYTGCHFVQAPGEVSGVIEGIGTVSYVLE
ncbi:MAG TPA: 2-keto-4-pentenoate hydratase [Pararobbsia sp.]|nr:2-keto-4-pentenoate hydratase [Pararobbsia sp.]